MRQRRIRNLDEKLDRLSRFIIENPRDIRGKWREHFTVDNPVYLEIGCGKGQFITENALRYTDRNFVAIEGHESVILRAITKAEENELEKLEFITQYVSDLDEFFAEEELDGIYLNFSDPWPKERHAKRRLTYSKRLIQYMKALKPGGFIQFKTDNDGLFDFTLEQIEECGFEIEYMTRDLHNSPLAEENITTEYEDKFSGVGKNINYVLIKK